ncbi:hypothetical protein GCM10022223_46260 [Kineosporia mesophila]|uniref:Helix-hairpin-helix DNA-binding motif class 1 domain-containing protein n=1 Tax=Kineosporia mesophila TaxID=566012 RepID=A0ABP7A349_9ACTN|nr:helix-hairpin-helix domain-containing protein [Kineosporia mesophila]MCD5349037.1 helix-hairpin-helix domain-containing protein [Kineosporia mesophila]
MRTDPDEPPRLKRILEESWHQAERGQAPGHGPWPGDWSGGGADDELPHEPPHDSLRESLLREGLVRGRIRGGSRWDVPVRAAVAAAVLAFVVVVATGVLLVRGSGDEGVAIGESQPLVSVSVAPTPNEDVSARVDRSPAPSAVGAGGAVPSRVHVVGQVRHPGVVSLGADARVQDAIEAAGGAAGQADLNRINLARKVVDGERILVPKPGQKVPDEVSVPPVSGAAPSGGGAPGTPVDLNTATVGELDALPGVGPVLAGRIVEWRQANGRFTTVDDLNEVSGIGDSTMEKLRPMVRV